MARKKAGDNQVKVGNITRVSGKVTIAGGDIYEGYTTEQVSVLLTQIIANYQRKPFEGRCPYKGLEVFEEEDADLFFGRERLVDDLIGRVKESRTVFITGPSGSGKSSLVRAGLIHAMKQGAIKSLHSERWLYETMKPGREPIKDLALAFSRLKSPELANYFQAHANEINVLNECAESVLSGRKDQRFLLFVDQLEEVFTQVNGEEERLAFINMLAHAGTVENGRVIVLFAMRSDFVSTCATYPALNELLSREFRQIGAMQPEELVSAIALPARQVGLPIEDELIARIINDMKGEPGALPLMQFALKDLFDSQQEKGGVIAFRLEDYLRHGGIHKSLERHADNSFAKLSEGEQELARSIFSGLIEIGRGTQDTRRTALFDELVPANSKTTDVETVVQKLADARLIITDEQAGKDTVTLAHEKLIDAWPWLNKLVNENRDAIALQNEITSDAKEWEDHKRDASYLYSSARLVNANEQLKSNKLVLSGTAFEYIRAAQARQRRSRLVLIGTISVVIAMLILAVIIFSNQSNVNAKQASDNAKLAQQNAEIASTAQANADIALARQLAAQAQSINATRNSKQMVAVLLAVQSMKMLPSSEAAQVLLNNLEAHAIARMTHDDSVSSVAFSPDGKYVVSGSDDNTIRVWEAATGKEIARMVHDNWVNSVAFSPDGKYVVSGSWDETARVWEAATGKEVARMTHDDSVFSVAFSPDGKYVVAGSKDNTTRVWEISTGKEVARMTHDDRVSSVAFSPDGKYVVSGSWDETARVWEAATGKEITRLVHDDVVESVAFSPDGKYVVSGSWDRTARVWEAQTGKEIANLPHDGWVYSVAFSPDGKYIVSGSDDNTARVWEISTGKEVANLPHDDSVYLVAFSPDGKYVVSGSQDGTARVWEVASGKEVARMTHDDSVSSVALSPDGKYVVSGSDDNTARVWELSSTGKEITRMAHDFWVNSVAFSPDGKYVVSGSWDKTVRVWEAATGKEVAHMSYDNRVNSVAFSPDGKYLVSGDWDNTVRVWEAATGKEIARMVHDDWVESVAFSPDGKYVVSGSDDNTARVWEISTGEEVARMTHDDPVTPVAFSPDGKYVVSGSWDGTARVWEAQTGKEVVRMTHDGFVDSVAFSPDGKYVVSGSDDNTARVWEISTGKEVARMTHDDSVSSVAFNPDGKYIVSGSYDNTVRVWEAATGEEVARIIHDDVVRSVAFSPDGRYVVSGSNDNIARIWFWQATDLIENACTFLPRNLTRTEWKKYTSNTLPYQAVCPNLPIESEATATPSPAP